MIGLLVVVAVGTVFAAPWGASTPRTPVDDSGSANLVPDWAAALKDRLRRANIDISVRGALRIWAASSLLGVVTVVAVGGARTPAGVVFGALVGAILPAVWLISRGDRESLLITESLPEMLELLARSLRGGADLHLALRDLRGSGNPAGKSITKVLRRVDAGGRLGDSLDQWVVDLGHRDASIVRAVLRLGDSTGGSMAPSLDRAAATIRERTALRGEIRALTSQSRASAMVIALSPVGFLALVAATDPKTSHVLFSTSVGRACLAAGLFLDGLGLFWMSRLTSGVE